jgi:uncharacterized repeat protein (TIGR03803 family)
MNPHSKARPSALIGFLVTVAAGIVTYPAVASAQLVFNVLHTFPDPGAVRPYSLLLLATDGNFYGSTLEGGAANGGTIFKVTTGGTVTTLHFFTGGADGANPRGAMIQAPDGNFYGTTQAGGTYNLGTVFKMTPAGVVTVLHMFNGSAEDGYFPYGGLTLATDGTTLYGTTAFGGTSNGLGTTFKITTSGTFTSLHTFTGNPDGAYPYAALVQANDGNFYGVTYFGGSQNKGILFKMTPNGTVTILHTFIGSISGQVGDGAYPEGALIQATDGNLWGTTNGGGQNTGVVFKSDLSGNLTIVHEFLGTVDGDSSVAPLLQGPDGNFYGTTLYGGSPQCGSVFKLVPGETGQTHLLHGFTCAVDGAFPFSGVTLAADGSFYGMTYKGGPDNAGTIFQVTSGGTFALKHLFTGSPDGARPRSNLIRGTDGNLYGTTLLGGPTNQGTVCKITPAGAVTVLHSFSDLGGDGFTPTGLMQASDGNFYGASAGSTSRFQEPRGGALFKITSGGTFTVLHTLDYNSEGDDPNTMIQGTDGNLYGTTRTGGAFNSGTVFKMTTTGTFTTLHSFAGGFGDGASPVSALVQANDGNFYGTTGSGGAGDGVSSKGTIFRMTPAGTVTILHSFAGYRPTGDGDDPYAPLIQAADGNLYGTTIRGGVGDWGTVFKMTLGGVVTILHSFSDAGTEGRFPYAPVMQPPDGFFYGTASAGGASAAGTVFQMTSGGSITILHTFNNTDGASPYAGLVRTTGSNLYGTTLQGGPSGVNGMGEVFRFHTVTAFTDDPLTVGSTAVKAIHITELRTRIDQVRTGLGLSPFTWTDPTLTVGVTAVKAVHINDLRLALTQAYTQAGLTPPTFTDTITAGTVVVKAVHIAELRSALQTLE